MMRHPFLLVGIFTVFLYFLVGVLVATGKNETAKVLDVVMPVVMAPMALVWFAICPVLPTLIRGGGWHDQIGAAMLLFIMFAAGLAPYVLADYVLDRWRRASRKPV